MKLIDILVEELPKRGGWDAKWHQCAQDGNGEVCFFTSGEINFRRPFNAWSIPSHGVARHDGKARIEALLADDYAETIITRDQYEAALAAKNDGWIEWGGGECPVSNSTMVEVRYRDGQLRPSLRADSYWWGHGYSFVATDAEIIAYRLRQPQEAEKPGVSEEDLNDCICQSPVTTWSGEGLPPVGCECEYRKHKKSEQSEWFNGVVKYASECTVVIQPTCYAGETVGHPANFEFRPIRSEAERKRHESVQALCDAGGGNGKVDEKAGYGSCWFDVYDAIAAGKIPGVKLED